MGELLLSEKFHLVDKLVSRTMLHGEYNSMSVIKKNNTPRDSSYALAPENCVFPNLDIYFLRDICNWQEYTLPMQLYVWFVSFEVL